VSKPVSFICVGTQKGGTTSLHYYLKNHPQILLPSRKELNYFVQGKYFGPVKRYLALRRTPGARAYDQLLETEPEHLARVQEADQRDDMIKGEVTPVYMYWHHTPKRIARYNPKMKLIMLLRNPVERAFSHYKMRIRKDRETEDFWTALQLEPQRLKMRHRGQHRGFSYTDRGFYCRQIDGLLKYFPKEQLLILKSDDLKKQTAETLNRICHFIGVDEIFHTNMDVLEREYHKDSTGLTMTAKERSYLETLFADEIQALEKKLGWDLSDWKAKTEG